MTKATETIGINVVTRTGVTMEAETSTFPHLNTTREVAIGANPQAATDTKGVAMTGTAMTGVVATQASATTIASNKAAA